MQVRHNTALLEQAVEHIVRSAAIPTLKAEAEANERTMRAQAFRRLASGCAIAAAAIGIGIGVYLAKDQLVENRDSSARNIEVQPKPEMAPEPKQDARLPPIEESQDPEPQTEIVTTNYSIFTNKTISMLGRQWDIEAGHHFESERDPQWTRAWCYTSAEVDGVAIKIDLLHRTSPTAKPIGPVATEKTLREAGLTELDALGLATKCAWLDNRTFNLTDIIPAPGRPQPSPNQIPSFNLVGMSLTFKGPIEDNFLSKLMGFQFRELQIDSPGGSIVQAMEGGRYLRQKGVMVTTTSECLSACVLVLAGGLVREAEPRARIGVHRFYSSVSIDGKAATEVAQQMSSEILQYLSQMGVDAELFHKMASVSSDQMVFLSHDQLQSWNLLGSKRGIVERKLDFEPSVKGDTGAVTTELHRFLGRDVGGGDYQKLSKVNLSDCEDSCKRDNKCRALTYDRWNKLCFLKSEIGLLRREPRSIVATKSGIDVKFNTDSVTFLQRKNRAFPDKPFRTAPAGSFSECLSICTAEDECEAINYLHASNSCALLKNLSPYRESPGTELGMKLQAP